MWLLLKSCCLLTLGVILVMFPFKASLSRAVIILFGPISFFLLLLSEELLRLGYHSRFGQSQYKKRMLLVGSPADNQRMRAHLRKQDADTMDIVGEMDLNENSLPDLIKQLHKLSPNGVILNAKHTFFGRVEKAIQVCEREGVEAWLVADFFQTQISRTSFDDFYGQPVMVFRSTPESSWQGVIKQVIDVTGALALILIDQSIDFPDVPIGASDFSVSIWVRSSDPSPGQAQPDVALISNKDWDSGGNYGWVLARGAGSANPRLQWNFSTPAGSRADFDPADANAAVFDGNWHHIAVIHARAGNASFYVDGVLIDL